MDTTGVHPDTVTAIHVACPTCGEPVGMPARLIGWPTADTYDAHLLVDLDPAREHAREHPEVLPAALAHFGVPW